MGLPRGLGSFGGLIWVGFQAWLGVLFGEFGFDGRNRKVVTVCVIRWKTAWFVVLRASDTALRGLESSPVEI